MRTRDNYAVLWELRQHSRTRSESGNDIAGIETETTNLPQAQAHEKEGEKIA